MVIGDHVRRDSSLLFVTLFKLLKFSVKYIMIYGTVLLFLFLDFRIGVILIIYAHFDHWSKMLLVFLLKICYRRIN